MAQAGIVCCGNTLPLHSDPFFMTLALSKRHKIQRRLHQTYKAQIAAKMYLPGLYNLIRSRPGFVRASLHEHAAEGP
jgi:hypothetical protein